jgi:tRNA-2-methylthio-N6-dimethylallyladenosine synthase
MNDSDSEKMGGMLEQMGYVYTEDIGKADVLLINTCCVRETAENKVYGLLGRLKKLKDRDPGKIIGIGGCMTQVEETARHIKKRFPYVNIIFGTANLHQLPELIARADRNGKAAVSLCRPEGIFEGIPVSRKSGIKAWVPIIHGCNNFCTYCIVPHVRGRERSRRPEEIIKELNELAGQGYKEVTLLGQNVNSYGKDLGKDTGFGELLTAINKIEGLSRIRFMTSHPRDFTDNLIYAIKDADKVCHHFHIPLQSGSDRILKAMHRGYDRDYYQELIRKIRRLMPGSAITTDIMVGFPGETEADFGDSMDVVEKVRFDAAFTFVYNKRKGTPAERMPGQVPEEEKTRRIEALIKKQNEISLAINRGEVGKVHQVLVEGLSKTNPDMVSGRTRTNKLVIMPGKEGDAGKTLYAEITSATLTYLHGKRL